ncbi:MAG TPA: isoprenylcysteine carboxylmethyltransferase family protein [Acidisarcina sp.]
MASTISIQALSDWTHYLWLGLILVCLVMSPFTKTAYKRESLRSELNYLLPGALAAYLLFASRTTPYWFNRPAYTVSLPVAVVGFVVAVCGITTSVWARFALNKNWSGTAELKRDHELVRRGPYRITRHPIYSGFLLALFGSALERGLIRSFVAIAAFALCFYIKSLAEERLMVERFGGSYLRYRSEVRQLVPFLL